MKWLTPQFWNALEALRGLSPEDALSKAQISAKDLSVHEGQLLVGFAYILAGNKEEAMAGISKAALRCDGEAKVFADALLGKFQAPDN